MELKLKNLDKNSLEFVIVGERHTFPNLLKSRLLKDSDVSFAAYKLAHPMDKDCEFILKTKTKEPKKVLLEACTSIEEDLEEFKDKIKKAVK